MSYIKFFFLILMATFISSCGSADSTTANSPDSKKVTGDPNDNLRYDSAGTLSQEDLDFLKDTFQWYNDVLVINYTLPEENCNINTKKPKDAESRFERARIWWDPFYEGIDLMGAQVIHVEPSELYGEAFSTYSAQYFWDEKGFLLDHFYRNPRGCESVLVVNRQGKFYQQNNHYTQEQVAYYIARLKSNLPEIEN